MSHCQICDYCETTDTPSMFHSEHDVPAVVRYSPSLDQWLCSNCLAEIHWNRFINIDLEETENNETMEENTPALPDL